MLKVNQMKSDKMLTPPRRIITDELCDTVYVSYYLGSPAMEKYYPGIAEVYSQLRDILASHRIPLRMLSNTADIWARDFMPGPNF